MDLEREKPKSITTAKVPRRTFLTGVAAGIGAAFLPRGARAQEFTPEQPIVDVAAAVAEAPLSPVEQLLANTELVDAVYLGNEPVVELRADLDEDLRLSINPEVTQEERDRFAELTAQSGQKFGYNNLIVLLSPYNKLLDEAVAADKKYLFGSGYNYKGKRMRIEISGAQIINRKCILRIGISDEVKANFQDPEFMETVVAPSVPSTVRLTLADGGLSLEDRVNRDQSILASTQALINNNFFQLK